MTLKTHLEYVRICVYQHILYIWPYVVNDKLERGGAKVYTFGKSPQFESKYFTSKAIGATRKKLLWQKSKMSCDISAST